MISKRLFQRFLSVAAAAVFVCTFHLCLIGSVYAEASSGSHECCEKGTSNSSMPSPKMLCCEDLDAATSLAKATMPSLSENKFAQKSTPFSFAALEAQKAVNFKPDFYSGPPELSFTTFLLTPAFSSQAPPLS